LVAGIEISPLDGAQRISALKVDRISLQTPAGANFGSGMTDRPFDLERFITAQDALIDAVRAELSAGRKTGHWMWFMFPQVAGLGYSAMSQKYAIASLEEAQAYLADPVLGGRLRELTEIALRTEGKSAHEIFGSPDDMKFRSCLTLFAKASREEVFLRALDKYFGRAPDPETLRLIRG
jgi:uncharacterized protein (DUF1810 family)